MLEVCMMIEAVLQLDFGEEEDSEHCKQEEEEEQKGANIDELRYCKHESIHNLLQTFGFLNQLEDS